MTYGSSPHAPGRPFETSGTTRRAPLAQRDKNLTIPPGLRRFRFRRRAGPPGRDPGYLRSFSVRDHVQEVQQGWQALRQPWWIAPFVFSFQRLRYARAGRIALLTPCLAALLVVGNLLEASIQEVKVRYEQVREQVEKVQEHHQEFVQLEDVTVLVLGTDDVPTRSSRKAPGRSDTMMLVNVQYADQKIRVLSIPRDTFVMVDYGQGIRGDKIAHAFRRGKVGWLSSKQAVERLTRLPIDHYVIVDYGLFREFIDTLGGIFMKIEKPMHYEDKAGGLSIHFEPGEIVLNGQKALEYVRFRKDGHGDLGRIRRQQKFVRAVARKLLHPATWDALIRKDGIPRILQHLATDIEVAQIPALAYQFRGASPESVAAKVMPGRHAFRQTRWSGSRKLSYFFVDPERLDKVLDEWFLSAPRPPPTEAEQEVLDYDRVAAEGVISLEEAESPTESSPASIPTSTESEVSRGNG